MCSAEKQAFEQLRHCSKRNSQNPLDHQHRGNLKIF